MMKETKADYCVGCVAFRVTCTVLTRPSKAAHVHPLAKTDPRDATQIEFSQAKADGSNTRQKVCVKARFQSMHILAERIIIFSWRAGDSGRASMKEFRKNEIGRFTCGRLFPVWE